MPIEKYFHVRGYGVRVWFRVAYWGFGFSRNYSGNDWYLDLGPVTIYG